MSNPLISARGLTKKFGDFTAVDAVDFDVAKGESFGLLGPNGAGKSTIMRVLAATSQRTSGTVEILGKDPELFGPLVRAHLGVVPQQDNLDGELTVTENLYIYGRYFGLSKKFIKNKIEELLEFSEPDILLLDEPTTGLDPQARHILWDRLFRLKEQGVTLVLTTHFMDEAEQLCDRLVVMDKGSIMAEGSPASLIKQYSSKEVLEVRFGSDRNKEVAPQLATMCERMETLPDRILMYTEDGEKLLEKITHAGMHATTSLVRRSSLEDVFLRLTGRSLIE
ncbi:MAG: ABC transporter ATP-binding protein [Actinobacteria bacterium]|nr:ABC transporter ATP-binding protein [Actinomycetota bacterium]